MPRRLIVCSSTYDPEEEEDGGQRVEHKHLVPEQPAAAAEGVLDIVHGGLRLLQLLLLQPLGLGVLLQILQMCLCM